LTDNRISRLTIIDTAGQERFRSHNLPCFKKADSCLLVYDITSRESFNDCKDYYIPRIKELCKSNIKVILLGNKSDLEEERKVSKEEGKELAISNNYLFFEISCKDNYNVLEAFENLVEICYKDNINNDGNNIVLDKKIFKKKKKCC
jgi:Ras-related protein Rab-1A